MDHKEEPIPLLPSDEKVQLQQTIDQEVAKFLAAGGKIQKIPEGKSAFDEEED